LVGESVRHDAVEEVTGFGVVSAQPLQQVKVQDQQAALLQSYLDLQRVVFAHFNAGALLWGIALVLAASVAWSMAEFPRWLTVLIALPGLVEVPKSVIQIVTGADLGFLILLEGPLLMVVFFAVAWVFWRRAG